VFEHPSRKENLMPEDEYVTALQAASILSDEDKRTLAIEVERSLPPVLGREVAIEAVRALPDLVEQGEVAIEIAQSLPDHAHRRIAIEVTRSLSSDEQRADVAIEMAGGSTEGGREIAIAVVHSLPHDAIVEVTAHLIYTMPAAEQQNLATEVVATLPSAMRKDIATEAVRLLAPRDQENLAMSYRSPTERRAGQERLIIIVTFAAVFVGITAAFVGTVLWKPESVQYMTPILTSIAGALAGFVGARGLPGSSPS
jgi:hypothetical protein